MLSRGFESTKSFFTADIDSRRKYSLCHSYGAEPMFLARTLEESTDVSINAQLNKMTEGEERHAIKPAFYDDGDDGPETVWRWAHQEMRPPGRSFVLSPTQLSLSECGYVFWDRARIEGWGVLQAPWGEGGRLTKSGGIERLNQWTTSGQWRKRTRGQTHPRIRRLTSMKN